MRMRRKTILLMLVACLLLAASAGQSRRLISVRGDSKRVVLHDAPPMIVFTSVVLGGFKGLLADVLWLRASLLQEDGRYLELVQLSDWITKLEPGISDVWAFHAWNMTYNVSVMMPKPDDRWRWVLNGISLLRDQGIIYNPDDPKLFFELGWFYQHKIGMNIDVMHLYYKRRLAEQMAPLLGPGGGLGHEPIPDEVAQTWLEKYRLDVNTMSAIDKRYGPLDWRLPEAHAVYWGSEGVKAAGEKGYIACDRVVYQSLMQMFRRGKLDFDQESDRYEVSPNPDMLAGTMAAFEESIARHPGDGSIPSSYSLFLREAVRGLDAMNLKKEARELFAKLSTEYGDTDTEGGYDAFIDFENK
jgi:hypothetical protein